MGCKCSPPEKRKQKTENNGANNNNGYSKVGIIYHGRNYPFETEDFNFITQKQLEENEREREIEENKRELEEKRIKLEQEQQKREMIEKQLMEERLQMKKEKEEIEKLRLFRNEEEAKKLRQKKIEEEEKEKKKNEFYDMVLDFNSFEQLKKDGWNSEFTEIGKKKYDNCKDKKVIVVGIVGSKNRGKSYLLGRIINIPDYQNPNGFFITTRGISCIFPKIDNNDNTFITLDTAGRDNPLLETPIFKETNKDELIRKVARDLKVTEIALNDFIIQESDVLITVLEQLSFNEQEMLKNLINQITLFEHNYIKENKSVIKRLIIIHNLMNITNIEGINKFINDVLLKSLTFSLTEQKITNLGITIYIQNLYQDKKPNIEIIHLIIGNDNDKEIRTNFNEPAFEYIRKNIRTQVAKKFEIIEKFKNFIIQNSKNYFEGEMKEDSLIIEKEQAQKDGKIIIPMKLSPKMNGENLSFKKFYINSKGIHIFSSGLEPRYSVNLIQIKEQEYIVIEFELSGEVEITELNHIIDKEQIIFLIKGTTKQVFDDEINKFEFQPIINRFITVSEEGNQTIFGRIFRRDKNIKKREYEIIIFLKEENKSYINKKYSECGINTIQIPIQRSEVQTSFEENEEDTK